eukprot:scaffold1282_cov251-Pinguiococcus_pyrenoidosus.AAC.17
MADTIPRRVYYEEEDVGKRIKGTKKEIHWTFCLGNTGEHHNVTLRHSLVSGKREIKLDGSVIIDKTQATSDAEAQHEFEVEGRNCRVTIKMGKDGRHHYRMYVNGLDFLDMLAYDPSRVIAQRKREAKAKHKQIESDEAFARRLQTDESAWGNDTSQSSSLFDPQSEQAAAQAAPSAASPTPAFDAFATNSALDPFGEGGYMTKFGATPPRAGGMSFLDDVKSITPQQQQLQLFPAEAEPEPEELEPELTAEDAKAQSMWDPIRSLVNVDDINATPSVREPQAVAKKKTQQKTLAQMAAANRKGPPQPVMTMPAMVMNPGIPIQPPMQSQQVQPLPQQAGMGMGMGMNMGMGMTLISGAGGVNRGMGRGGMGGAGNVNRGMGGGGAMGGAGGMHRGMGGGFPPAGGGGFPPAGGGYGYGAGAAYGRMPNPGMQGMGGMPNGFHN